MAGFLEKEHYSRREFIHHVALGSLSTILSSYIKEPFSKAETIFCEKRNLNRSALIIAGGTNEKDNFPSYFTDLVLWYQVAKNILSIKPENISLLYFEGKAPSLENLIEKTYTKTEKKEILEIFKNTPIKDIPINGPANRETILKNILQLNDSNNQKDQLLVFRSGHCFIEDGNDNKKHSVILLPNNEGIYDNEFGNVLRKVNTKQTIVFLMQCYANYFLEITKDNPNLAIFTSSGDLGFGEKTYLEHRNGIQWPWSYSARYGLINPLLSDLDGNNKVNLSEIEKCILKNDYTTSTGIFNTSNQEFVKMHPGFSYGKSIDPDKTTLLQY